MRLAGLCSGPSGMFSSMAAITSSLMSTELRVKLLAAVQHAVAHRADLVHGGDHAVLLVRQRFEHQAAWRRCGLSAAVPRSNVVLAADACASSVAALDADALHQLPLATVPARRSMSMSWYFSEEEPALTIRMFVHAALRHACACAAVMATVATISSTEQPRDRSLHRTGPMPCMIGPIGLRVAPGAAPAYSQCCPPAGRGTPARWPGQPRGLPGRLQLAPPRAPARHPPAVRRPACRSGASSLAMRGGLHAPCPPAHAWRCPWWRRKAWPPWDPCRPDARAESAAASGDGGQLFGRRGWG